MSKPDFVLQLTPAADADFEALKTQMIETLKLMIEHGYHPGYSARAMIVAGASCLADMGGVPGTVDYLEKLIANIRLGGRPVGNA